jgi:hypothetical protein
MPAETSGKPGELLPNPSALVIDARKIVAYALSADHPRGRNKARVFASALGIRSEHASLLIAAIREAAHQVPVSSGGSDAFGTRYVLDFSMHHRGKAATVRTCWIVRTNEDFARLTSCFVL